MSDPQSGEPVYVGIDVGGTNIKTGIVTHSGRSLAKTSLPTEAEKGIQHGLKVIYQTIDNALALAGLSLADVNSVGLATPGTMDIPGGWLLEPPDLPGWWDFPIRDTVGEHLQKPTVLQNDANAAAYGEFWLGRAREAHGLVFWTLGTGIGCGIIVGNVIIEGEHSTVGVRAHHHRHEQSPHVPAGQYGTLEAFCGARAVVAALAKALATGRESLLRKNLDAGQELTPFLIAQAAEQGDHIYTLPRSGTCASRGGGDVTDLITW